MRKHTWLVISDVDKDGRIFGSFLSYKDLKPYFDGCQGYEDKEILPDELFDALKKAISVTKRGDCVVIHFVEEKNRCRYWGENCCIDVGCILGYNICRGKECPDYEEVVK